MAQGASFDEMYDFDSPADEHLEAPHGDAEIDFDGFDFNQQAVEGNIDGDYVTATTPQPTFPAQRYACPSFPNQTHPSSIWRPLGQSSNQFHYPDPDIFSQTPIAQESYYPLQPLPSANTMTQHNFGSLTPAGQQFSSIDHPLFMHGNMEPAMTGTFYEPIPTYQDNETFNPEDLALSAEDLVATAIRKGWTLPEDSTQQAACSEFDMPEMPDSDGEYMPSSSVKAKASRRNNPRRPKAMAPNGIAKKGRPCAKPQTEERRRVNERRMEGYYRRKNDQGNLEKARQQSRESYWRRKQRRIAAGEKVRSYNASTRARANKRT